MSSSIVPGSTDDQLVELHDQLRALVPGAFPDGQLDPDNPPYPTDRKTASGIKVMGAHGARRDPQVRSRPATPLAIGVMVPQAGLEPARLSTIDFESTASTISPLGPAKAVGRAHSSQGERFVNVARTHQAWSTSTQEPTLA